MPISYYPTNYPNPPSGRRHRQVYCFASRRILVWYKQKSDDSQAMKPNQRRELRFSLTHPSMRWAGYPLADTAMNFARFLSLEISTCNWCAGGWWSGCCGSWDMSICWDWSRCFCGNRHGIWTSRGADDEGLDRRCC